MDADLEREVNHLANVLRCEPGAVPVYRAVYCQGGTESFVWRETTPTTSKPYALDTARQLERAGYGARVIQQGESLPSEFQAPQAYPMTGRRSIGARRG